MQWSFPRDVVDAVRWHHDPDFPEKASAPIDIIYLSNLLCQTNGDGNDDEAYCAELSPAVIERLGLEISQFDEIKARVAQWVDELSDALTFN
jgi:HD-like signal output (HDOD) protein